MYYSLLQYRKFCMMWCIAVVAVVVPLLGTAQSARMPLLEKRVSINAQHMPMKEVMDILEEQAAFSFSYSPSVVDESKMISVRAEKRPLREVLGKIFGTGVKVKEKGKYIILSEVKEEKKIVVGGYVENEKGEPISDVTLFDERTLVSSNTNEYGYYEMRIERRLDPLQVSVRKTDYHDTLYPIKADSSALSNIIIREEPRDSSFHKVMNAAGDFAVKQWNEVSTFMFPENPETMNVDDTIYRHFQFSFVPYVGTNRRMSGNVINDWSFNLIGGYGMGVRKGELAGMFNMNRADVEHMQIAGMFNLNGGDVEGAQFAGFSNTNLQDFKGAQFAGFANYNHGATDGALFSGFANINVDSTRSVQFAGFSNINLSKSVGFFASGFANVNVHDLRGVQVAGFTNVGTGAIKGTQISGFANVAVKEIDGVQIAGFCNYANDVKGTQIAPFNVCDSISGIPIGVLSYVNKGYHNFEIGTNDIFHFNMAFRTGVRPLYNIFTAGMKLNELDTNFWSVGYGLGTSPRIMKNLFVNVELTSSYISKGSWSSNFNLDNQLYAGLDVNIFKHVAITGGPLMHAYLTERDELYPSIFNGDSPTIVKDHNWDSLNVKMWWGWRAGIRFSW